METGKQSILFNIFGYTAYLLLCIVIAFISVPAGMLAVFLLIGKD